MEISKLNPTNILDTDQVNEVIHSICSEIKRSLFLRNIVV